MKNIDIYISAILTFLIIISRSNNIGLQRLSHLVVHNQYWSSNWRYQSNYTDMFLPVSLLNTNVSSEVQIKLLKHTTLVYVVLYIVNKLRYCHKLQLYASMEIESQGRSCCSIVNQDLLWLLSCAIMDYKLLKAFVLPRCIQYSVWMLPREDLAPCSAHLQQPICCLR